MHLSRLAPLAAALLLPTPAPAATQFDIPGPPGSGAFGTQVLVLPNGNFVVTDPLFDQASPPATDVGAVYLFNPDGLLISRITGSTANDRVGNNGITLLKNGNFVVSSSPWNGGRGAVTWGHASTGFIGGTSVTVSAANSLVGSAASDQVGVIGLSALPNGNYVMRSPFWSNGSAANAGAITLGNGTTGTVGPVSATNSLVGTTAGDQAGGSGITILTNGNFLVRSSSWDNGATVEAGAVTWISGTNGLTGTVSATNSLVGTTAGDQVGSKGFIALTNGNYVVRSSNWDNPATATADVGAVTWGNGLTGISGPVSATNSLVGTTLNDQVGDTSATALTNGNYLVISSSWDNPTPATANVGAATWGNGTTGITGPVTPANSLVGTTANDNIGISGATALTNGNYVVRSQSWDNTALAKVDAGAATWGNGSTGITGPVTPANSLVGTTANDLISSTGVTALTNGNYVVRSRSWNNGTTPEVGAATWGNGTTGIKGPVTPANSLVGTTASDNVSNNGVTALTNGNYVVSSSVWDNTAPAAVNAGAVTWGNGFTGIKGPVTPANSLVGTTANDQVGNNGATDLPNGNYVIRSHTWNNGTVNDAGAVTWGNGTTGIKGPVSQTNSLVGTSTNDKVGIDPVVVLSTGDYIARNGDWNNGPATLAGALTWADGRTGITGPITPANSLVGSTSNDAIGFAVPTVVSDNTILFAFQGWDNGGISNAGAVTFFDGRNGTAGPVTTANSVIGTVENGGLFSFEADTIRKQMIVGRRLINIVTLFRSDRLRTLAKTNQDAPGAADIAYAKPGTAAVNLLGSTVADSTLTGSGSASGKNRALFAFAPGGGTDLVLQTGTPLSALGGGLPANAVATALSGQIFQQPARALFQATVKGTGVTPANNRLLLLDNGASVSLLHRLGSPIAALGNASLSSLTEVLQSHDLDLITLAYKLKSGGAINSGNDEGLLFLDHSGNIGANIAAREGQPAFNGGGTLGAFTGKAASGIGSTIFFTALFKPTGASPIPAVHSTNISGSTKALLVASDAAAPNSGAATFNAFPAITHQSDNAIVKATLKNSPVSQNEGLYSLPSNLALPRTLLTRKGDPIGGGLNIDRIVRFWPAGPGQLILHLQVSGTNVNPGNNQVLVLRQNDTNYLLLLRTGFPSPGPGTGTATVKAFSAIDVNPASGRYAILGTLNGAPASSNQALWTGDPTLGADSPAAQQLPRLPQVTLRKGNPCTTESTPSGIIRSIALKPALDPTGAGGRGLAQALGASGDLALFITTDRNLTELVLLDR